MLFSYESFVIDVPKIEHQKGWQECKKKFTLQKKRK